MSLIFVRHASIAQNSGDPSDPVDYFRGWINDPLSPFGQKEGAKTANWFQGKPINEIYSSDLTRAHQMAQMISQVTGVPVQTDPRLRPWNVGMLTNQEITPERLAISDKLQKQTPDVPIQGGESYNQFLQRYTPVVQELMQKAQNSNIVMVAHHRNALALNSLLYGQPTQTKGPPDPSGVMLVGQNGMKPLYTPPEQEKVYGAHTTS